MKPIKNPIQAIRKYTDNGIHIAIVTCNKYSPEDVYGRFEGHFSEVGYRNAVNEKNEIVDLINGDPTGVFDPNYDDLISIYEEDGNDWKLAEGEDARCRLLLEGQHLIEQYATVYTHSLQNIYNAIGDNILNARSKKNLILFDSLEDAFNYVEKHRKWHLIRIIYYSDFGDIADWKELNRQDVMKRIEKNKSRVR